MILYHPANIAVREQEYESRRSRALAMAGRCTALSILEKKRVGGSGVLTSPAAESVSALVRPVREAATLSARALWNGRLMRPYNFHGDELEQNRNRSYIT